MLRRTLQCLLEKERATTVRRAVMAKARPNSSHHNSGSGSTDENNASNAKVDENIVRHIGFAADTQHSSVIDIETDTAAPPQPPQPSSMEPPRSDASEDAYRFLLHHIDSEIAALKRRVMTVGRQRTDIESSQTRRIRELFECIERPWLLLESIPAPQLPNKALEVYAKEQATKQRGNRGVDVEHDAVFLDACRRNWRGMPIAHRKLYEVAARRNEHLRKELKKKMANGCSFFEDFCEQVKEWTAETARDEMRQATLRKRGPPARSKTAATAKEKKSPSAAAAAARLAGEGTAEEEVQAPTLRDARAPRKGPVQRKPAAKTRGSAPDSPAQQRKSKTLKVHRAKKPEARRKTSAKHKKK
ncbi:hypothetical protein DQ04_10761000 [Trypanosoma grayi]|uniref:hypothetical protein n=1 Tax=Trypanosoma grayi TaxID=71804 RepID=UPI0004F48900|nr:hypothetical protein DQ04_10761000 [Trypanosoma grayi]KEG07140.1 hypothetical protein DQ04_10761000 [Trypanosoma grayi]